MSSKPAENKLNKINYLNRILKSIRHINQLLIREKDPHNLVGKICDILVANHGFKNAWILLLDEESNYKYAAANSSLKNFDEFKQYLEMSSYPACTAAALKNSGVQITPYQTCQRC